MPVFHDGTAPPSSWVLRWTATLPPGARVLDFAAGAGRNATPLARAGLRVIAADRDRAALAAIGDGVVRVQADLEADPWPFAPAAFDAVIVCNFLHRARLDELFGLVRAGGRLVYETFAQGNERYGRPSNPAFLLAPGELLAAARRAGFEVLGYEHGLVGERGAPAVVQRICAVLPPVDLAAAPLDAPRGGRAGVPPGEPSGESSVSLG